MTKKKAEKANITDLQSRQKFGGSWRMLLEAIAYHLKDNHLEKVVLLPSPETVKEMDRLRELYRVISDNSVDIIAAGDLSDDSEWTNGVHYEKARDLRDCLHYVYEQLKKRHGYLTEDIIVDITSGQKVCSSVATAMSLTADRQFQYISTHDYKVKTFNISYHA